jgi:hypothetical protein
MRLSLSQTPYFVHAVLGYFPDICGGLKFGQLFVKPKSRHFFLDRYQDRPPPPRETENRNCCQKHRNFLYIPEINQHVFKTIVRIIVVTYFPGEVVHHSL